MTGSWSESKVYTGYIRTMTARTGKLIAIADAVDDQRTADIWIVEPDSHNPVFNWLAQEFFDGNTGGSNK